MSEDDFNGMLARGVETVLETMFFTAPLPPADAQPGGGALLARVVFEGEPSGTLCLRISEASARSLAASFLGEDEESLGAIQIGQVVCELANMLCGWLLSQVEHDRHFKLGASELLLDESVNLSSSPATSEQTFAIENGILTVALCMDDPHER